MKQSRKRKRQTGRYHDAIDVARRRRRFVVVFSNINSLQVPVGWGFWPSGYYANRKITMAPTSLVATKRVQERIERMLTPAIMA